ncbi:SpaH/EbpB family LPXTG-anchored major pilin [Mediterraneibacter sp. 210702-DFI.5.30]|uniref:SpaH/EbpB family LPXTG-anchored major pilin n=1 Tax=Mediterraneibacter sp. 210702-DFI.5.30 TaxID=2883232 RepID=UPI001D05FADD|nr:SpaH/EbpB family LPXTG-anchored major pilin [Mediterraneibacter sp. 210702-DFI.5.30]MCB6621423.1 SpaH/EbpB family LPXTG-anchored major pilin [Mediterraneibacter sp. 210702-DFI.5.30]
MGKFRKMLAGVLSAAMVLSTMTVTAFAAETKMPTIDTTTTKTGSITIHKYEYNGNSITKGTGETTDESNVPSDAKPLKGAGFTIYKVADENELIKYYNTNPESLPSIDTYVDKASGKIRDSYADKLVTEKTTNDKGIAKFDNLALGFYVVVETTTPDKVTDPVDPFIVSVPMTTKDGDNWLYDVHVYPKNKTTYGKVTLVKQGNTDSVKLSGVIFVLQKKNGENWENVETSESDNKTLNLTTDVNGKITVDGLSQGRYRFIEKDRGANNNGYIMDGATAYDFTVNPEGTITYNSQTGKNITITVKNEKPDMTKQVQKRDDVNTWGQDADYNVGDMVPYKITIDVPSNITKLKEFTLTDTPTNLEDDLNSVVVKCEETTLTKDSDYTIGKDTTNGKGFKITFTTASMTPYAGKQIVVTYNAELLSTAVTTTKGNPNTAKLEYSNKILPKQDDKDNPNKPESPDTKPGKDSIEDNAVVYTFKLQIQKNAADTNKGLDGVTFDLYKKVSAGTEGALSTEEADKFGFESASTWKKVETLTTRDGGKVEKSGLANGTYYLVETKTAEGYNLLKAPVKVELNIVYTTTTKTEWVTDENGVKTLVKNEITKTEFKEGSATSTGTHTETIINKKGFTLPTTGGMGTVLFSIAGFALMAGAAFVLLKGRRKDA